MEITCHISTVVCGALYYVFGRYRLVTTAFISLCGTFAAFMVYRITALLFHSSVAWRAALLTLFFPSLILWSAMALKDMVMITLILVALDSALRLRHSLSWSALIALALSAVSIWYIRFYIFFVVSSAVAVSLLFSRGGHLVARYSRPLFIAAVFIAIIVGTGVGNSASTSLDTLSLARISEYRHGMAATANSGFSNDVDISTASGALAFLPIGMAVTLLGPFPWQMTSLRPLLTLPEMLLWWSLIPSVLVGIRFSLRRHLSSVVPIFVFGSSLTVLYSMTLGNVGAAFRQRGQILVFLFIFAAVGKAVAECKKRGIDSDLLRVVDG